MVGARRALVSPKRRDLDKLLHTALRASLKERPRRLHMDRIEAGLGRFTQEADAVDDHLDPGEPGQPGGYGEIVTVIDRHLPRSGR
jgi:hypothetical protein